MNRGTKHGNGSDYYHGDEHDRQVMDHGLVIKKLPDSPHFLFPPKPEFCELNLPGRLTCLPRPGFEGRPL
jgi:hypothetical protein